MENMAESQEGSWRSQSFRQNVRAKIEEAIRMSGNPTTKSVPEMETHVFQKAKTREEYLGFVARLIIHVREMSIQNNLEASTSKKECAFCFYSKTFGEMSEALDGLGEEDSRQETPQRKRPHPVLVGGSKRRRGNSSSTAAGAISDTAAASSTAALSDTASSSGTAAVTAVPSTSRRIRHKKEHEITLQRKKREHDLKVKLLQSHLRAAALKEKLLKKQLAESDLQMEVLQKKLELFQKLNSSADAEREISLRFE